MPIQASEARLAASPGDDQKRILARKSVAQEFLRDHVFDPGDADWDYCRRVLQTIDYAQPVVAGPAPPAPKRLAAIGKHMLGAGFFTEQPKAGGGDWWSFAPNAPYLKWCAPFLEDDTKLGGPGDNRWFIPAARANAPTLANRERR
jgi:hypothetical protein